METTHFCGLYFGTYPHNGHQTAQPPTSKLSTDCFGRTEKGHSTDLQSCFGLNCHLMSYVASLQRKLRKHKSGVDVFTRGQRSIHSNSQCPKSEKQHQSTLAGGTGEQRTTGRKASQELETSPYESASKLLVWGVFIPMLGRPVSFFRFCSQVWGYRFCWMARIVFPENQKQHVHGTLLHKVDDGNFEADSYRPCPHYPSRSQEEPAMANRAPFSLRAPPEAAEAPLLQAGGRACRPNLPESQV